MSQYQEGQRWISHSEPELGLGTLVRSSPARVSILFTSAGQLREYAVSHAPIKRVKFREGDAIKTCDDHVLTVDSVVEEQGLLTYICGSRTVPEALLSDRISFDRPQDRLLNGQIDPESEFELRWRALQYEHDRRQSPVCGFLGGRIDLIPHQLYIAHEVSSRQAPRVLLSDEVGLGKTIEACLILHRLLLTGRVSRVLILVPDSLVHQWFVEMLRRFNLWLRIYDEERCQAIEEGNPDSNPFLDDQLILCSLSFLAGSPVRAQQAQEAGWDILVVDEAHHLEWTAEGSSPEYALVEALGQSIQGMLLLTATPQQLGLESHFARLRLLDPDRYSSFEGFLKEAPKYQVVAEVIDRIESGKGITRKLREKLLKELPQAAGVLARLEGEASADRPGILTEFLDLYGPGRVVFRNTRVAMSGFPKRVARLAPLDVRANSPEWADRTRAEFLADVGSGILPDGFSFEGDPRIDWVLALLKGISPEKVLLICRSREKAALLAEELRQRANLPVGLFHEGLTLVQRDRNAAWFSEEGGTRILVCSEIGSEGRNFQFAHHLVLFDLPLNPELLEQRIGRLDRIGQTEEIQVHVPYLVGSPAEVLARWYHEGLDAFESSLPGGDELLHQFGEEVRDIALASGQSTAIGHDDGLERRLVDLLSRSAKARIDLLKKLESGRDRLLERNSFRPGEASGLISQIQGCDSSRDLESFMLDVFERFSVPCQDLAPRSYLVEPPGPAGEGFPEIKEGGLGVTFDRTRALSREDVTFLSWDHPMVTGAIDLVLSSERGNSSFGVIPDPEEKLLLLEARFVLESVAEGRLHIDRFLPATPVRVVLNYKRQEVTEEYPEGQLKEMLEPGSPEKLIKNPTIAQQMLPAMIRSAKKAAERQARTIIEPSLERMNDLMGTEIHRLRRLQEMNDNVRPVEVELLERYQEQLASAIQSARVRLDAVRLIWRGPREALES